MRSVVSLLVLVCASIFGASEVLAAAPQCDLGLSNLEVSRPSDPYSRIYSGCSVMVKNYGSSVFSNGEFVLELFLSSNQTLDSSDKKIGDITLTDTFVVYKAGNTYTTYTFDLKEVSELTCRFWTKDLIPYGKYYVFAKIRIIGESYVDPKSDNNYCRTNTTFDYGDVDLGHADLELKNLMAIRPIDTSLRTFRVCEFDIINHGRANIPNLTAVTVEFYLSQSPSYVDGARTKIGETSLMVNIPSGESYHIQFSDYDLSRMTYRWTPSLLPEGDYYVFAKMSLPNAFLVKDTNPSNDYCSSLVGKIQFRILQPGPPDIEIIRFAGTAKNSYFFVKIRQVSPGCYYCKLNINLQGQQLKRILPAKDILPPTLEDFWTDSLENIAVSLVKSGIPKAIPVLSPILWGLEQINDVFKEFDALNNNGATSIEIIETEFWNKRGLVIYWWVWTAGDIGLDMTANAEYIVEPPGDPSKIISVPMTFTVYQGDWGQKPVKLPIVEDNGVLSIVEE